MRGKKSLWGKVILAAALAAVMTTAALAVGVSQGWVHFFGSEEEIIQAASAGATGGVAGYASYEGDDYEDLQSVQERADWLMEHTGAEETLLAQAQGTPEEGWSRMKTVECQREGRTLWESTYQADRFSDLTGLWDTGLDLAWLEEHYSPVPRTGLAILRGEKGEEASFYVSMVGELQGEEDQIFNLQYIYEKGRAPADSYILTQGYHEYYETADGVQTAIRMETTRSGKSFFWVDLDLGEKQFYMGGSQLELEEIHAILDHLGLAGL